MGERGRLRRLGLRLALVLAATLFQLSPIRAQSLPPTRGDPERVTIGIYLAGLHRLDFVNGTFAADFWVWTINDASRPSPIENVDIVNEISKRPEAIGVTIADGRRRAERRIQGLLQTRWDTWHFPFDRQTLQILLEPSFTTAEQVVYVADTTRSGVETALIVPGWRIVSWDVRVGEHRYGASAGEAGGTAGSRYTRLIMTLEIERQGEWTFLNLVLGALVAFTMLALSFRMNPTLPPTFAGRMGVITASVFTVVISMRAQQSFVGHEFGATLVDRIHLLTLVAGFIAGLAAAFARYLAETNCEAQAISLDRKILLPFTVIYVLFVGAMIAASLTGFRIFPM